MSGMGEQIFSGVRVLDLTWYISGPYCTKVFADYGADVIKVERPGEGDPARRMGPFWQDDPHPEKSLLFSNLNLNKRGITLNLKNEAGRELLLELVHKADILVESFRPGVMERLGLGYETLKAVNPRLVVTAVSNFGQTGPYRDYELSELVLNGFHSMINCGEPDRYPLKKGGYACLHQGGLVAALATLAAYWCATEQGLGQYLDVSLLETQAGDVDRKTVDMVCWTYSGRIVYDYRPGADTWRANHIMPSGIFPCADGFLASFPILTHWPRFVALMKDAHPELEKLRFPEDMFDLDTKGEMDIIWYEWLAGKTKREAMEACQAVKWFGTAVNTPADAVEDPQFLERGFWVQAEHPVTGRQTYPGAPVQVGEGSWQVRRPAPLLGEHNAEVYGRELGRSEPQIQALIENGVI